MSALEHAPLALPRGEEAEGVDTGCYELDHRRRHGIEIFLFWFRQSNILTMTLNDLKDSSSYYFQVPNENGMDAINHPFIYQQRARAIGKPLLSKLSAE